MIRKIHNAINDVPRYPSGIFYTYDLVKQMEILRDKIDEIIEVVNNDREDGSTEDETRAEGPDGIVRGDM